MRNLVTFVFMLIAVATTGCGATRGDAGAQAGSTAPTLTGASVTFQNRDSGKDADSAVAIELLRNNAELAAESKLVGTKFDDNAPAGPMALSVGSPFRTADTDTARLRIRMTPDGKDEWTFDLQMALTFGDLSSGSRGQACAWTTPLPNARCRSVPRGFHDLRPEAAYGTRGKTVSMVQHCL